MNNWINRIKQAFSANAQVLMYHRIATPESDPWQLAVSPQNFEEQLQVLQKLELVVPATELVEQLQQQRLKKAVVITFDDGYADNYHTAAPLLAKYELPATIFCTLGQVGTQKEFWWDELEQLLLHTPKLPQQLNLVYKGEYLSYDLQQDRQLNISQQRQHRDWRGEEAPPTKRAALYLKLWKHMSPLKAADQQQLLQDIRSWAGVAEVSRPEYCCMSANELQELARESLFTIGGHTLTHPALPQHPKAFQLQEVLEGKKGLQALVQTPVDLFAYPSGSYDPGTVEAVQEAGFKAAFTTDARPIQPQDDLFRLGRYQVKNLNGKEFERQLQQWFKAQ